MEWYPNYEIGIPHIDAQHKELVAMVSTLQDSLRAGGTPDAIAKAIRFLVEYTQKHFHDEEELMRTISFYDRENHIQQHQKLVKAVKEILINMKKGKRVDPYELIDFLSDWLVNHIRQEDKKIGKAIEAQA